MLINVYYISFNFNDEYIIFKKFQKDFCYIEGMNIYTYEISH